MAVLRGAAGWIIRQAAAMQAAAGGRRWRACPPRWRRWWLRCCCEVWQGWQAVGAVQVVQVWRWCMVIGCGGLLLAGSSGAALAVLILPGAGGRRCDLLRRVHPGAYRGRWRSAPRSGAGLLALTLIRAQRFQLATFQRGTACAGGCRLPEGSDSPPNGVTL